MRYSGRLPCAILHYQVLSGVLFGPDRTLQTVGCPGNASVTAASDAEVDSALGGSVSLTGSNATGLTLSVPVGATTGVHQFSVKQLAAAAAMTATGVPGNGLGLVGAYLYDLQALVDPVTMTSSFAAPLTVRVAFTSSDLSKFDSSTLTLRQWDAGTGWSSPTACVTTAQSVACQANHFSIFGLFANAATPATIAATTAVTTAATGAAASGSSGTAGISQLPVTGSSVWLTVALSGLVLGSSLIAVFLNISSPIRSLSRAVDTAPPLAPADPSSPDPKRKRGLEGDLFFAPLLA